MFWTAKNNASDRWYPTLSVGFLVILTTLGVIQTCGSLTFKAAGQVRNIGIIVISILAFGDKVTVQQAIGYAINLVGGALYTLNPVHAESS